jgi:hypothetical protein
VLLESPPAARPGAATPCWRSSAVGTEFGIDIILSSHLLEEVRRSATTVIIAGARQASGPIAELTGADALLVEVDDRIPSWSSPPHRRRRHPVG